MSVELKFHYLCPECRSYLRVWNNIIFTVKTTVGKRQGLLLLNPELGNYTYISHPSLKFNEGESVDFYCPVCHADLTALQINENLIRIIMIDEDNFEYDIYFSKIAGEHTTFKIEKDNIIEHFGEQSSSYVNYFMSKLKQKLYD